MRAVLEGSPEPVGDGADEVAAGAGDPSVGELDAPSVDADVQAVRATSSAAAIRGTSGNRRARNVTTAR